MRNPPRKHHLQLIGLLLLAPIVVLWSWNTLAQWLVLPELQYRHALAALALLLVFRWVVFPSRSANGHLLADRSVKGVKGDG